MMPARSPAAACPTGTWVTAPAANWWRARRLSTRSRRRPTSTPGAGSVRPAGPTTIGAIRRESRAGNLKFRWQQGSGPALLDRSAVQMENPVSLFAVEELPDGG